MRIAIITSRFPYPIEKGDKLRIYHQIKHLSKEHEIYLFSLSHQAIKENEVIELKKYCKTINIYKLGYLNTIIELFLNIFKKTPFQVAFFFNKSVKKSIEKEIIKIHPDKIYYQLIRTVPYYTPKFYSLIDFMDAFSLNFSRKIKTKNPFRNYFLKIETQRLKKYEIECLKKFNSHLIISQNDANAINENIEVVKNGISKEYLEYRNNIDKIYDLVFVGNMRYEPNIEAFKEIEKISLYYEKKYNYKLKILIAGAYSDELKSKNKSIKYSGWVDNIKDEYLKGKIFLAPLKTGAGLQNKILEAMSLSMCCITTSLVNDSVLAINNKEIIIKNEIKDVSEAIFFLLHNKAKIELIGNNAKAFIIKNYKWENINKKLENLLSD